MAVILSRSTDRIPHWENEVTSVARGLWRRPCFSESARSCASGADIVSELVAKGENELGMVVITQIMTTPGVELVGPIPREIQSYIRWSGAVSATSAARGSHETCSTF